VLAQAEDRLTRFQSCRQPAQPASVTGREMVVGAADVLILRRFGKALGTGRINQPQTIRLAVDLQLELRGCDRPAFWVVGEVPLRLLGGIRYQQSRCPGAARTGGDPNHSGGGGGGGGREPPPAVV